MFVQTCCQVYAVKHNALFIQSIMLHSLCPLNWVQHYYLFNQTCCIVLCCQTFTMLVNQTFRVYAVKHIAGLIQSKMLHSLYALKHLARFVQLNMFQNLLCQKYCTAYTSKHVAQFIPSNWLQVVLSIKHVA